MNLDRAVIRYILPIRTIKGNGGMDLMGCRRRSNKVIIDPAITHSFPREGKDGGLRGMGMIYRRACPVIG
jgi:hypothetical protein